MNEPERPHNRLARHIIETSAPKPKRPRGFPTYIEGSIRKFPLTLWHMIRRYRAKNACLPCTGRRWIHTGSNRSSLSQSSDGRTSVWKTFDTQQVVEIGRFAYGLIEQLIVVQHKDFNNGEPALIKYKSTSRARDLPDRTATESIWALWEPDDVGAGPHCNSWIIRSLERHRTPEGQESSAASAPCSDGQLPIETASGIESIMIANSPSRPSISPLTDSESTPLESLQEAPTNPATAHTPKPSQCTHEVHHTSTTDRLYASKQSPGYSDNTNTSSATSIDADALKAAIVDQIDEHQLWSPHTENFATRTAGSTREEPVLVTSEEEMDAKSSERFSALAASYNDSRRPPAYTGPPQVVCTSRTSSASASTQLRPRPTVTQVTSRQASKVPAKQDSMTREVPTANFVFRQTSASPNLRERPFSKCKSVGMLCSQAVAAGIATSATTLLSIQIAGQHPKTVVRDDQEDFEDVKRDIENAKSMITDIGVVEVGVVPYVWDDY